MNDPVCGMTVEPESAPHAERDGQTYYFCSEDCREKFLSARTTVGVARREWTREVFIQQLREALPEFATRKVDPALWAKFEERIYFCHGSFDEPETYKKLKTLLGECEKQHHTGGNVLFYLSVQPVSFASIARVCFAVMASCRSASSMEKAAVPMFSLAVRCCSA